MHSQNLGVSLRNKRRLSKDDRFWGFHVNLQGSSACPLLVFCWFPISLEHRSYKLPIISSDLFACRKGDLHGCAGFDSKVLWDKKPARQMRGSSWFQKMGYRAPFFDIRNTLFSIKSMVFGISAVCCRQRISSVRPPLGCPQRNEALAGLITMWLWVKANGTILG